MLYCVAYKQPPLWYLFIRRSDAFAYDFAYCPPCQLQETKREREHRRRGINETPAIEELSLCLRHTQPRRLPQEQQRGQKHLANGGGGASYWKFAIAEDDILSPCNGRVLQKVQRASVSKNNAFFGLVGKNQSCVPYFGHTQSMLHSRNEHTAHLTKTKHSHLVLASSVIILERNASCESAILGVAKHSAKADKHGQCAHNSATGTATLVSCRSEEHRHHVCVTNGS